MTGNKRSALMEIITHGYQRLALIECSCCRDAHTLKITEDDKELYFDFKETDIGLVNKIKAIFDLLVNYKKYISGDNITANGLILHYSQIEKLYALLKEIFPDIIEQDIKATKRIPIKHINKKETDDYESILFDNGEIILYEEIHLVDENTYTVLDKTVTIGYHLSEQTKLKDVLGIIKSKRFYNGNFEGYITKDQMPEFMNALLKIIKSDSFPYLGIDMSGFKFDREEANAR
jgi:hypothetical protein